MKSNEESKPRKMQKTKEDYVKTYVEDQMGGKKIEISLGPNATAGQLIKVLLGLLGLPESSDFSLVYVSKSQGWRILSDYDLLFALIKKDPSSFLRLVPSVVAAG